MTILIRRISKVSTFIIQNIIFILMLWVAFLVVIEVFLRYVLHMPMQSVEEVLAVSAIWLYLMGSVNASRTETHIDARLLEILSNKVRYKSGLRFLSALTSIIVLSWLSYWAYDLLRYSIKMGKVSMILRYPLIISESSIFLCIVPMLLYTLKDAFKYACIFKNNDAEGGCE
ncbi:MAG: TRAP transporter small permease [Synergistales bacterium]|jgi:TRAP-type C4-dicarboxylate transport system permease small subunit